MPICPFCIIQKVSWFQEKVQNGFKHIYFVFIQSLQNGLVIKWSIDVSQYVFGRSNIKTSAPAAWLIEWWALSGFRTPSFSTHMKFYTPPHRSTRGMERGDVEWTHEHACREVIWSCDGSAQRQRNMSERRHHNYRGERPLKHHPADSLSH